MFLLNNLCYPWQDATHHFGTFFCTFVLPASSLYLLVVSVSLWYFWVQLALFGADCVTFANVWHLLVLFYILWFWLVLLGTLWYAEMKFFRCYLTSRDSQRTRAVSGPKRVGLVSNQLGFRARHCAGENDAQVRFPGAQTRMSCARVWVCSHMLNYRNLLMALLSCVLLRAGWQNVRDSGIGNPW